MYKSLNDITIAGRISSNVIIWTHATYQYNEICFLINAAMQREEDLRPFFLINIKDKRLQYTKILLENLPLNRSGFVPFFSREGMFSIKY